MRSFAVLSLFTLASAAPLIKARSGTTIPGAYIVVLKNESADEFRIQSAIMSTVEKTAEWKQEEFNGFAAKLSGEELQALQDAPEVDYIEEDAEVSINAIVTQTGAPWGLARISSTTRGGTTYRYDDSAGVGTCSYIIDTGLYAAHSDFGGRASQIANFVDSSNTDGNGHGTHVAGTIGGTTYGVAKRTTLLGVKVLNASGSGTNSGVISGMNFVVTDARTRSCPNGVVVNMSLGGSTSTAINSAAAAITSAGHFLAVAAGNSNANAASFSPASEPSACTVGATTSADAKASYSNYGALVDIWAPGSGVLSAWIGGTTASRSIDGTSMASPHIAGLGAYFLSLRGRQTPAALCSYIATNANRGVLTGVPSGTVNALAYNGA
ncbi:hypothetical protein MCOR25_006736 [Pyricularia grisea]|uniref:Cuticle-degrading protease n=1 Tax=Pyricularia grisea TaxID=148305 RepID=A0A6P8BEC9_PYRGI|nr:uncharacterized protein PgNI_04433 [Pyricularia grisea]KAI6360451.1 hypothetical protein MCOR25_006736 [Pyricularia grisea]TLD14183.1 hypothetical protein PgNI_04433 [Pyricularia grisea]